MIWKRTVNVTQAMNLLNNGYGRLLFTWDDRVWEYWRHLCWNIRSTSEAGGDSPAEVDAYLLTPEEAQMLGVDLPKDNIPCILFILYEINVESYPLRAVVAGETRLKADSSTSTSNVADDA